MNAELITDLTLAAFILLSSIFLLNCIVLATKLYRTLKTLADINGITVKEFVSILNQYRSNDVEVSKAAEARLDSLKSIEA